MGWFFSEGSEEKWPHAPLLTGVCWQCLVFLDITPISASVFTGTLLSGSLCALSFYNDLGPWTRGPFYSYVISSKLITFAKTLFPNKVIFTGAER